MLERARKEVAAAALGCAAAAQVATGLGSDAGEFDLEGLDEFAASTPTIAA